MIIVSGWLLTRDRWQSRREFFYFWSSLIILNPLFSAFATSSTADVLHIGFLMLSIAIAHEDRNDSWVKPFIVGLVLGLAVITKFIPVFFGLALIAIAFLKKNGERRPVRLIGRDISIYVLVPGSILLVYIWWLYTSYSVFVSRGLGPSKVDFSFKIVLITLGKYLMFLGLCCGPVSVLIFFKNYKRRKEISLACVLLLVAVVVGNYLSNIYFKEMGFAVGFPIGIVVSRFLEIGGFVFGVAICLVFLKLLNSADRLEKLLYAGVFPTLLAMSLTIPRQRYIMILVPAVLILVVDASDVLTAKSRRLMFGVTAFGFAAVSLLGLSYLRAQGNAAENMAVWMEDNGLIHQVSAGVISMHAGQHFHGISSSDLKYDIISTPLRGEKLIKGRILHREPMNVLGRITRVYVLRELPKAP